MKWITAMMGLLGVGFMLVGCASKETGRSKPIVSNPFTLLYQASRQGVLEPCGCHTSPFGGIDREFNALGKIRQEKDRTILYVDAGNMLSPLKKKGGIAHHQHKALAITAMLSHMGLEVFAPGPMDYGLGLDFLKKLESKASFKFVSTNVLFGQGKPVFPPYHFLSKGGVVFAILSVTPEKSKLGKALRVLEPNKALDTWLPVVSEKADVVILLSQLTSSENVVLAERYPTIRIIVGAYFLALKSSQPQSNITFSTFRAS